MSKVIKSEVKALPGNITVKDPINYPDFAVWKNATDKTRELDDHDWFGLESEMWRAVLQVVEKFDIELLKNTTSFETLPAAGTGVSHKDIAELLWQLVPEIGKLINGAAEVPNE